MANVDLLSKRLVNWPDQSKLRAADNGAEVALVADALGIGVDDVKAAVQKMISSGFGAAEARSNALHGDSASVAQAPAGNLGWDAERGRGPNGVPVQTFLLDIGSFGSVSAQAEAALTGYVKSFGIETPAAEAAAKTMLADALGQTPDRALEPQARVALESLRVQAGRLQEQVSLASKQVFAAKADALGKQFFEPGTLKQMRNPEILHRDLRDSTVTNPSIERAKQALSSVEATYHEVHGLYADLLRAGESFAS